MRAPLLRPSPPRVAYPRGPPSARTSGRPRRQRLSRCERLRGKPEAAEAQGQLSDPAWLRSCPAEVVVTARTRAYQNVLAMRTLLLQPSPPRLARRTSQALVVWPGRRDGSSD